MIGSMAATTRLAPLICPVAGILIRPLTREVLFMYCPVAYLTLVLQSLIAPSFCGTSEGLQKGGNDNFCLIYFPVLKIQQLFGVRICGGGMWWTSVVECSAPFIAMVMVECTDVGVATLSKAASSKGLASSIAVVYYNALGTLILLPVILFLRRKQAVPLSFLLLLKFFLLAFVGTSGQILYLKGVEFSSPLLSSAMGNLIPIFTLILAVSFRMEKLEVRSSSSQAKIVGAIVSVVGTMFVTLYEGPPIHLIWSTNRLVEPLFSVQSRWVFGGLILAVAVFEGAVWNTFQTALVKEFPERMTIVFFFTFFTTIQSAVFCLMLDQNPEAWKLTSRIEIAFVVYTAIFGSIFRIAVHTWCLHRRGPLYVTMFKPLGIVIAFTMTSAFLGDPLHIGSAVGSVVIALGFYAVMWGKLQESHASDASKADDVTTLSSSSESSPLLKDKNCGEV